MERTGCVVAGGGPAGVMLGLLLARAGVEVAVLEKHRDFLRDFRGDTVHPSTLRLLDELGLGTQFAALSRSVLERMKMEIGAETVIAADFSRLRGPHKHIAMVPQAEFLALLAEAGAAEPKFSLRMGASVVSLRREGGRVTGVDYLDDNGIVHSLATPLTVGCDGRWSTVRHELGLALREWEVPMDVWQVRVPKAGPGEQGVFARFGPGYASVTMDRGDYYQTSYLIPRGQDAHLRSGPIEDFRSRLAELFGWTPAQVSAVRSWDDVKLLEVTMGLLPRWHAPGALCIGDAAHPMSPVGGVGVNLAVQDAVATARLLAEPLRRGEVPMSRLAAVRRRRLLPTAAVQSSQRGEHEMLLRPALAGTLDRLPAPMRVVQRFPVLSGVTAYLGGVGLRPEHAPAFARRSGVDSHSG
ncbi:FAD-dependent oxidoreductase [Amycolatopsis rubida]|uniref:FAD-dependent oxidoreductase n=1 Tax=Amycolatopsis rubida TaxID=112413 RepID=A0ABX0BJR4_9PSEU|nr:MULTISPECIES: FAD-dependent oxidoreductase [Amycolatopsis]MYW89523.1 FAD-dependent oxidoreductase [Amycolatopsis rubida]NEC54500.1 FAD-dependent oxidoreductase [Amycolatopsis rubida]OAP25267.1 2-octaprenyl-3-methyl-6-methoxy-1,4-benzoquinol hydroxylase [Amycolatopsis sp. M39]